MNKKTGRNELCPCGSGKKHKNCCLRKNNLVDFTQSILRREIEELRDDLGQYIFSMFAHMENAYKVYKARAWTDLKTMLQEMMDNSLPAESFFEWFLFDYALPSGSTPFREYINKKLKKEYRTISLHQLEEWANTPFSIYYIKDIKSQEEYFLEDFFTKTILTLYLPESDMELAKGNYLILRPLSASNNHVYLYSIFQLPPIFLEAVYTTLKADKDEAISWQEYLKEKGDFLLKTVVNEEYSLQKKEGILTVDISKTIGLLLKLNLIRDEYETKLKELKGLNLLEAYWEPDLQDKFQRVLKKLDDYDNIRWVFRLDEELLEKSNWQNTLYYEEAQLLLEKMKRCYFPLEIEVALAMWHEFSANKKPTFRKKGVWAAAVEYALSYLNDSYYVTQKDIANKYQVSANSISKNYDTFLNYWDIFGDTKDDPFDFPSIQSIEKRLDALRTHLEQAQPKDEEELQQILEKINEEGLPEELPVTPKSQSQNIIYDAWEIDDSNEKVRLAKKALQIYPYNADAYLILAQETAESLQEQKVLLLQGLEAGEKSLGSNFMQNNMGNFWGIVSTRSYMRVKYTLAQCLWELGEKEEALTHMRELLKLNPNDNQGVRYLLTKYLLETNKLEECKVLLEEYKEDFSAFWLYNKALLDYKMEDKHSAEIYLQDALQFNPYVPDYLLGIKDLPPISPPLYKPGEENEAQIFAFDYKYIWLQSKGALEWLLNCKIKYSRK